MRKLIVPALATALVVTHLTAFAGWKDRNIVEQIRSVGNTTEKAAAPQQPFSQRWQAAEKQRAQAKAEAEQGIRTVNRKPVIAIVYENNAKTKYDTTIDKKLFEYLDAALPAQTYELIDGAMYKTKLSEIGIEDIADAERADILSVLEDSNVDYFLYLGVGPVTVKAKSSLLVTGKAATASIPFRVIDVKNNRYLYTKTYTEAAQSTTPIGSVGSKSVTLEIMTRVGKEIQATLEKRLPKSITYTETIPLAERTPKETESF